MYRFHMKKYLLFLSYAGHEFRGAQKQFPVLLRGRWIEVNTVQETLEIALKTSLRLFHDVNVMISSRTDAGVHALRTSVHVQLQKETDIDPDVITIALNKYFTNEDISIRIHRTYEVDDRFSARSNAISRSYLYRLAIRKSPWQPTGNIWSNYLIDTPPSEHKRSFIIQEPDIDVKKMEEAAELFRGTKDYFSFMARSAKKPNGISTIRTIYHTKIKPGQPLMPMDPITQQYNFWDIIFCGRSFLYRQIRRSVGVLLAVGKGRMTIDEVKLLFDKPDASSWNPRATCVPPYGLYLLGVDYHDRDLGYNADSWRLDSEYNNTLAHL